jgi:CHAT domain-containing protein
MRRPLPSVHTIQTLRAIALIAALVALGLGLLLPWPLPAQDARERAKIESLNRATRASDSLVAALRRFSTSDIRVPVAELLDTVNARVANRCPFVTGDRRATSDSAQARMTAATALPSGQAKALEDAMRVMAAKALNGGITDTAAERAAQRTFDGIASASAFTQQQRWFESPTVCRDSMRRLGEGASRAVRYTLLVQCFDIGGTADDLTTLAGLARAERPAFGADPYGDDAKWPSCDDLESFRLEMQMALLTAAPDPSRWPRTQATLVRYLRGIPDADEALTQVMRATSHAALRTPSGLEQVMAEATRATPKVERGGSLADSMGTYGLVAGPVQQYRAVSQFARMAPMPDSMRLALGTLLRVVNDLANSLALRSVAPASTLRRLEYETSTLVSFAVAECGGRSGVCIDGLYPAIRRSKTLAAIAIGTALPTSEGAYLRFTPSQEQAVTRAAAQYAEDVRRFGEADPRSRARMERDIGPLAQQLLAPMNKGARPPDPDSGILRPDEVFVDFYRYRPEGLSPRYGVFVTDAARRTRFADIGRQDSAEAEVLGLWNSVTERRRDWATRASAVRRAVWSPVEPLLPPGVTRVIVSGDGKLSQIPWALLERRPERHVATVVSWGQLVRSRTLPDTAARRALVVSDIAFGDDAGLERLQVDADITPAMRAWAGQIDSLPARGVTENALRTRATNASLVHIVTHNTAVDRAGIELDAWQQLERTRMALSGDGRAGRTLSAAQLAQWDLRGVSLLVLASCRSGGGAVLDGQGVIGFPLAASAAGVRAMLVSLWPSDNGPSTAVFLEAFYDALLRERGSLGDALTAAQATVREQYPDPVFWAGWTILGDGDRRFR